MPSVYLRLLAVAAVVISFAVPAMATAQEAVNGSAASSAPSTKAQSKAQRKAARKEARAKKNAELKKLEDAGYNPAARNDINYPQNLQDAEKKAAGPSGASQ